MATCHAHSSVRVHGEAAPSTRRWLTLPIPTMSAQTLPTGVALSATLAAPRDGLRVGGNDGELCSEVY